MFGEVPELGRCRARTAGRWRTLVARSNGAVEPPVPDRPVGVDSSAAPPGGTPGRRSARPSPARKPAGVRRPPPRPDSPTVGTVLEARGLVKAFGDGARRRRHRPRRRAPASGSALLGPNGAGKTTTLLMLLGAITPDARHRSRSSATACPQGRSRRHGARSASSPGYLPAARPPARARGAVDLRRLLRAAPASRRRRRRRRPRAVPHRPPRRPHVHGAVVGPAHARRASSRRSSTSPRCSCSTSPPASLDPDVAYRVRTGLLDVAANDGTALLVTSHNMVEVERLCERVVFLAGGRDRRRRLARPRSPTRFGHGDLEGVFLHLAGTVVPRTDRSSADRRMPSTTAASDDVPFSWLRVRTVVRRHFYVLWRSPAPLVRHRGLAAVRRAAVRLARRVRRPGERRQPGRRRRTCSPGSCSSTSCSRARSRSPPASWRRPGAATSST